MDRKKYDFGIAYPFLYEDSSLVDYEIATDQLASTIGVAISICANTVTKNELLWIIDKVYHLNGSIRGKNALSIDDTIHLNTLFKRYEAQTRNRDTLFVLPTGTAIATIFHTLRVQCKQVIRIIYKLSKEQIEIDSNWYDFLNVLSNYFFVIALKENMENQREELAFISKSY